MGILQVDNIIAQSSANVLTLGVSGNTVTVPANVTFNALGANVYIPNAIAKLDAITPSNTSTYNLTYGGSPYSPASATACLVSLNGIIQAPTTAFTISANTISFSTALTSTDVIDFITVLAAPYTLNVPGDGTVGITQLSATGTPSSSTYLRGDNTWAAVASPIVWNQTVQSTNFTASVNVGYMVNTSTAAVTVTLPASPSIGDQIQFVDFQETAAINNIILNPNGLKIDGVTSNTNIVNSGEGVTILYTGTTRGWIPVSAANEGTTALASPYSIDFLVIAGGGGGSMGGGGAGGYRTSTQSATPGTIITVTVGDGGAGQTSGQFRTNRGSAGSNSSISGSGLTTITSAGGGGGGARVTGGVGIGGTGGSGGGSGGLSPGESGTNVGGAGNTPSTSPSQGNNGGSGEAVTGVFESTGGGGGAGGTGGNAQTTSPYQAGNGGTGTASSITGSSVTRAGGGGGSGSTPGSGGAGGGGNGTNAGTGGAGTANTGSGGGGNQNEPGTSGAGGKGVVILSMATIHYTGTSSGSPTVTTSGSNTILTFNGSGTYTA